MGTKHYLPLLVGPWAPGHIYVEENPGWKTRPTRHDFYHRLPTTLLPFRYDLRVKNFLRK
jgi:hypothetical protein